VAAQGGPCRLPGQPFEQALGAVVEAGSQLWAGEVFGREVEGVDVAGGCGTEQANRILLPLQGSGGLRVASRASICSSSSVAVRGWRPSGWITACRFPSPTTET
jgi:hypothetical protein